MAGKASLVLLKVGDGMIPEVYSTVGGLRTSRMTINRQIVEARDVGSGGWRKAVPKAGVASVHIEGRGILMQGASGEVLRERAFSGAAGRYRFYFSNAACIEGEFMISQYIRMGEVEGAEQVQLVLESAGTVEYIVAE